jgi:hypothetical protein
MQISNENTSATQSHTNSDYTGGTQDPVGGLPPLGFTPPPANPVCPTVHTPDSQDSATTPYTPPPAPPPASQQTSATAPNPSCCVYPAPDDVMGWTNFLNQHGYAALKEQIKEGHVGKSVLSDPGFGILLQDAHETENRYWTLMSELDSSDGRVLDGMVRNMAG